MAQAVLVSRNTLAFCFLGWNSWTMLSRNRSLLSQQTEQYVMAVWGISASEIGKPNYLSKGNAIYSVQISKQNCHLSTHIGNVGAAYSAVESVVHSLIRASKKSQFLNKWNELLYYKFSPDRKKYFFWLKLYSFRVENHFFNSWAQYIHFADFRNSRNS